MTEAQFSPAISNSILGALGDGNTVTQNIVQAPGQPSPHRLPPDLADFTGRTDDIQALEAVLKPGGTAAISAVNGMGGVGKSALAIHVAHRLMSQFADAQLYVDLRGQSALPLSPEAVLVQFLQALTGRDESQLPSDVDALAALYRSVLVGKRALIVLDNARDVAQVKPLLPASATCAVLITSRQALATLAGSQRRLDLMPLAEAVDLFRRITGQENSAAVQAVVVACGRLPLAIRIAGALLQRQRGWTVEKLAALLADEKARLDRLQLADLDVRASFNVSYQWLTAAQQQVLALAGTLVGQDFGVPVLAAVAEREEEAIATDLDELVAAQLLEVQPASERYQLHDLVRLFAREQLTATAQSTAEERALDWYCQQAGFWNNGLDPVRCRQLAESWAEGTEQSPAELEQILPRMALNWFEAERGNWVAVVQQLGQGGRADAAVALAANLASFYGQRSHWSDWVTTHEIAKTSAEQAENWAGVAQTLIGLGVVYANQGRWAEAIASYEQSLATKRELGDRHGVAQILIGLGVVYADQGRWAEAIASYEQSLETKRELGDRHGVAQTLNNLGLVYWKQGRWAEAIASYEQSLETKRELGDRHGVAQTLNNLGNVYLNQGCWEEAIATYEQSLETKRELGDRHGVAQTLHNLGNVYLNQGCWEEAIAFYEQSLATFRELGDRHGVALTLNNLGNVYADQSRWSEAIAIYEQTLATFRELGDRHGEGQTLANLGMLYKNHQDRDRAKALWQAALTKLHPSSPVCSTVQQWLTALDQPQRPRFIRWLLPLVMGGFLVACLLRGQWWLAVGGVLVGAAIRWGRAFMVARGRGSR
jgi:tetratricopeptide (TPR) repeat protein